MLSSTGRSSLAYAWKRCKPADACINGDKKKTKGRISVLITKSANARWMATEAGASLRSIGFFNLTQVGINCFCLSKVLNRL